MGSTQLQVQLHVDELFEEGNGVVEGEDDAEGERASV